MLRKKPKQNIQTTVFHLTNIFQPYLMKRQRWQKAGCKKPAASFSPADACAAPRMCPGRPWSGHAGLCLLPSQDLQTRRRDAYACPRPLSHLVVDVSSQWVDWAGLLSNVAWANRTSSGHKKSQWCHQQTLATYCLGIPERGKRKRTCTDKTWFCSFTVRERSRYSTFAHHKIHTSHPYISTNGCKIRTI